MPAHQMNPALDQYTVGWICALPEEYKAGVRMLDVVFPGLDVRQLGDNNTYTFGRVGAHHVVIGSLPLGRYGTNSAAVVARDMARTFPNVRYSLLVGIGGGAPTRERDIRLGDVVVSVPQPTFGGVVQYDLGIDQGGGQFRRTGYLSPPPVLFLGAIPELRRRQNDPRKPDRIAEHIQRMKDVPAFRRPQHDQLYRSDYHHQGGTTCRSCSPGACVQRPQQFNTREIATHYGTIASGNTLVKDPAMRDRYAHDPELNVLCFEMEAAGLMNNIPCLVIRGICDYCDSHKNDEWHNYAALTASAYARELLLIIRPERSF
ncbi:hypothetical protein ASPZODRAFT_132348 [Penicilliopsis zonata CBS 506.65]|uniref:Nucleoside phosphorylase domain-containing protein n=1 Tax=Penicilliopsis zonata CBS 506.65 TaxID=1073090 RepID=A0A1L9SJW5_9EURO|nr:hypothetical protein ASPZODRAFT_132348 [Penicilliopsis zonata CBS 506.65]OJJ47354.1 hypothetical protein ASPZODRAFT_132348 [Penicilliopsis zonata CBS 506.65]